MIGVLTSNIVSIKEKNNMGILDTPIGANKRFLVTMDGNPFAGFDTLDQAQGYIAMQKTKTKAGGREKAFAAERNWAVKDRGE
jgi:hypothetical protein